MKKKNLLLGLTPLAILPTIAPSISCGVIEKINQLPKQIDGLDWTGRIDGLFTKNDYFIDTEEKTVTYWNATDITAKDLVFPNYVWYKGEKFKAIIDDQCFINSQKISGILELNDWMYDIPADCFHGCSYVTQVVLHNYPTSIGDDAFNECQSLASIFVRTDEDDLDGYWTLNLEKIGKKAFYHTQLSGDLIFSNKLKTIGDEAFCRCFMLETVNLVFCEGLETVGPWSFSTCSGLTDVYLPHSITMIGNGAFQQCVSLKKIHLPQSAMLQPMTMELGANAFYLCKEFENFTPVTPRVHKIGDGCFYGNEQITYKPWLEQQNQPLSLGESAFGNCQFTDVTIQPNILAQLPNGDVRDGAFGFCQNLHEIDFSLFTDSSFTHNPPQWSGLHIFQNTQVAGTIWVSKTICDNNVSPIPTTEWSEFFMTHIRNDIAPDGQWVYAYKE